MVRAPLNKALPPATYSWTGLYVGGHLGTGWANNDWENLDFAGGSAPRIGTGTGTGFLGGAQAGVNRQLDAMVFGIEADVSWAVLSGDACHLGGGIPLCNSRADRFGTVAGRFGVVADRALVYLKGGAAWLHSTHVFSATAMATGTGSKWGWTAGAGVEYGLTRN
jgi:outer membrane immunogenic protein